MDNQCQPGPYMETSQPDHLPRYVAEALAILRSQREATDDGLPRAEAAAVLRDNEFEPAAIEVALERLLQEGYLYEAGGQLRVTPAHG